MGKNRTFMKDTHADDLLIERIFWISILAHWKLFKSKLNRIEIGIERIGRIQNRCNPLSKYVYLFIYYARKFYFTTKQNNFNTYYQLLMSNDSFNYHEKSVNGSLFFWSFPITTKKKNKYNMSLSYLS